MFMRGFRKPRFEGGKRELLLGSRSLGAVCLLPMLRYVLVFTCRC